jgi:outer membrane protein assembly factor BamB
MRKLTGAAAVAVICLVALGCDREGGPVARDWSQYQADAQSRGFNPVSSEPATGKKWNVEVGRVAYAAPVVGPNGTIYVGNVWGELVAVDPDGSEKWRVSLFPGSAILSTPAVDAEDLIWVLGVDPAAEDRFLNRLYRISPAGELIGSEAMPGFTTAALTIWEQFFFINLVVIDDSGNPSRRLVVLENDGTEIARVGMGGCARTVCGTPPDIFGSIWDHLGDVWDFIINLPGFDDSGLPFPGTRWLDPTIVVVDRVGGEPVSPPVVIGIDDFCMTAFEFDAPALTKIWTVRLPDDDCEDPYPHSSPAAFPNGLVVVGDKRNQVRAFDYLSGEEMWRYDADERIKATPASFGRQVFVATEKRLHLVDYDGDPIAKSLPYATSDKQMASPALSSDYVYLSTVEGMSTYSFDVERVSTDHGVSGGYSGVAIGRDGTIYVATPEGQLHAYGRPDIP